jgi:hypothetical protein
VETSAREQWLMADGQDVKGVQRRTTPPSKPSGLARNPIIVIPYLLSMPLALLAPEDVFTRWPIVKAWFELVAQYVPIVGRYANRSAFPEVSGLYFSVVLPIALCFFWATITNPQLVDRDRMARNRARFGIFYDMFAWLVAAGLVLLAYFAVAINPGYDFGIMPINRSRMALAFFGPLFAGGLAGICLGAGLKLVQILFTKRG